MQRSRNWHRKLKVVRTQKTWARTKWDGLAPCRILKEAWGRIVSQLAAIRELSINIITIHQQVSRSIWSKYHQVADRIVFNQWRLPLLLDAKFCSRYVGRRAEPHSCPWRLGLTFRSSFLRHQVIILGDSGWVLRSSSLSLSLRFLSQSTRSDLSLFHLVVLNRNRPFQSRKDFAHESICQ